MRRVPHPNRAQSPYRVTFFYALCCTSRWLAALFLLCVNAHDRVSFLLKLHDRILDEVELQVAVFVVGAFKFLAHRLQTVAGLLEQSRKMSLALASR